MYRMVGQQSKVSNGDKHAHHRNLASKPTSSAAAAAVKTYL